MLLPSLCLLITHLAVQGVRPASAPVASAAAQNVPLSTQEPECVVCHVNVVDEPERRFGQSGQWTLGLSNSMQLQGFRISVDEHVTQDVAFSLDLIVGYFLSRHISVGGLLGFSHSRLVLRDPPVNSLSVGPQLGWNLELSPRVSFYPNVGLLYGYYSDRIATASATTRLHTIDVGVDVAFVITLREHLSISVGPYVKQSVYGRILPSQFLTDSIAEASSVQTYYGLKVGIVGWL
jgi:hypothetical protein